MGGLMLDGLTAALGAAASSRYSQRVSSEGAWEPLELPLTDVFQAHPGTCQQILHRSRDQNLTRIRLSHGARTNVHGHAGNTDPVALNLPCVETHSDANAEFLYVFNDVRGAVHSATRTHEGREKSIAGGVDLFATVVFQMPTHAFPESAKQGSPGIISKLQRCCGRVNDVSEHYRDDRALPQGLVDGRCQPGSDSQRSEHCSPHKARHGLLQQFESLRLKLLRQDDNPRRVSPGRARLVLSLIHI